jgi:hypothetical protein
MSRGTVGLLLAVGFLLVTAHCARLGRSAALAAEGSARDPGAAADEAATDPVGPNAACYMCHIPYVREELSQQHLRARIRCIKCHGVSTGHVNDENIGATTPDVTYGRDQVNAFCRRCHARHDVPPDDVIARWLERALTEWPPVCTDCHGTHRIQAPAESEEAADDGAGTPHG